MCRRNVDHASTRHISVFVVAGHCHANAACLPFAEYQPDGGRPGWNSSSKAAGTAVALTLSDANQQESLQEMRQRFMSRLQQVGHGRSTSLGLSGGQFHPCTAFSQGVGLEISRTPATRMLWCLRARVKSPIAPF